MAEFQELIWGDNELTLYEKLNKMCQNQVWIEERLWERYIQGPAGVMTGQPYIEAVVRDVFAGDVSYENSGTTVVTKIPFLSSFVYPPLVKCQYVSNDANFRQVNVTINGFSGEKHVSAGGFTAHVVHNKGSRPWPDPGIRGAYFIHYVAIGTKTPN